ncbi:MAG: 50S ribosomal protein L35 [Clostridia bacterium]|nr:50S ribosomal protein L35 [Clostridia bacterium]
MPKMKSHSGSKKRFRLTATGKVKRGHVGHRHILTKKNTKRKRRLRGGAYVSSAQERTIRTLIQG